MTSDAMNVLLVEDSRADADLIARALREVERALSLVRVADEAGLRRELAERRPDIVLSDFSMPGAATRCVRP